jgi:hypothetical protein
LGSGIVSAKSDWQNNKISNAAMQSCIQIEETSSEYGRVFAFWIWCGGVDEAQFA